MPETRVVETTYGIGGYDPTLPNNNIVEEITAEISDAQLYQEELAAKMNERHEKHLTALKHWELVTDAEKDVIQQELVKWAIWKDGMLKFGVL